MRVSSVQELSIMACCIYVRLCPSFVRRSKLYWDCKLGKYLRERSAYHFWIISRIDLATWWHSLFTHDFARWCQFPMDKVLMRHKLRNFCLGIQFGISSPLLLFIVVAHLVFAFNPRFESKFNSLTNGGGLGQKVQPKGEKERKY